MRLTSLWIDNFGTLNNYRLPLLDGLNCIYAPNGSGKTTLSVFIKVMLYGFADTKKSSITENERKRYRPWQGGNYGGSLCFSHGGREYVVERSFGLRPSEDSFVLRYKDSGTVSKDFGACLGEEILGIDAQGFERTLFLSERSLLPRDESGSISSRLSELGGSDGDIGSLASAIELLEDRRRLYKKRGGGGEIAETASALSAVRARIEELEQTGARAEVYSREITEASLELSELKAQIKALFEKRESERDGGRNMLTAALEHLRGERDSARGELEQIERKFPLGMPGAQELAQAKNDLGAYRALSASAVPEDDREKRELARIFANRGEQEISALRAKHSTLLEDEQNLLGLKEEDYTDRAYLKRLFPARNPSESEQTAIGRLGGAGARTALILLGALTAVAGGVLGNMLYSPLYALCAVGGAVLIGGVIWSAVFRARLKALCRALGVGRCGVKDLKEKAELYRQHTEAARRKYNAEREALEASVSRLRRELEDGIADFPIARSGSVSTDVAKISSLYEKHLIYRKSDRSSARGAEEYLGRANAFMEKYCTAGADTLESIERLLTEADIIRARLCRIEQSIADYERTAQMQSPCQESSVDKEIASMQERQTTLTEALALKKREYERAMEEYDAKDELIAEKDRLAERLALYERNLSLIQKTEELLNEAASNMQTMYLGGVRAGLKRYTALIGEDCELNVDTELRLSKSERGTEKSEESYSRGLRELYSLALKLSLGDALFGGEFPFAVLDDPFIALDDKRGEAAREMLRELSRERQIIYLTCSEARAIR